MATSRLLRKIVFLLIVGFTIPLPVFAAPTAITKQQDLQFGKIICGSGLSGTVTIAASGARSSSGSVILFGGVSSPAQFTITGTAGKNYVVTLPATFTIISGADQMTVSGLIASIPLSGIIPVSGQLQFTVGGVLTVVSTQMHSTYNTQHASKGQCHLPENVNVKPGDTIRIVFTERDEKKPMAETTVVLP